MRSREAPNSEVGPGLTRLVLVDEIDDIDVDAFNQLRAKRDQPTYKEVLSRVSYRSTLGYSAWLFLEAYPLAQSLPRFQVLQI